MNGSISIISGRAWTFGDNVDTDQMAPLVSMQVTASERRPLLFPGHPRFVAEMKPGELIVAGRNWGCGSSREQAPQNLMELGVGAVVAESFARIFFRNSIALGFVAVACPGIAAAVSDGDQLELDVANAIVRNITHETSLPARAYTPLMLDIVTSGGLLAQLARRVGSGASGTAVSLRPTP
jgi:3-isopropylmalate/(R)-2-methylmalate dehydratase small subunit